MPVGVFHYRPENCSTERSYELDEEYSLMDVNSYQEETQLKSETLGWYKSLIGQGRRCAYFMYILDIPVKADVKIREFQAVFMVGSSLNEYSKHQIK